MIVHCYYKLEWVSLGTVVLSIFFAFHSSSLCISHIGNILHVIHIFHYLFLYASYNLKISCNKLSYSCMCKVLDEAWYKALLSGSSSTAGLLASYCGRSWPWEAHPTPLYPQWRSFFNSCGRDTEWRSPQTAPLKCKLLVTKKNLTK